MADIKAKSFNFGGSDRYIIPQDFIINVTEGGEGNFTADKTYAEILEAYNMGHTLIVSFSNVLHPLLYKFNGEYFTFQASVTDNRRTNVTTFIIDETHITATNQTLSNVPAAYGSYAGKVLTVSSSGDAVWGEASSSGSSGSSGAESFLVSFTYQSDTDSYSADKSFAEIVSAYEAGKIVLGKSFYLDTIYIGMLAFVYSDASVCFQFENYHASGGRTTIYLLNNGSITYRHSSYYDPPTFSQYTVLTSGWSSGVYSFESDFPNTLYDIEIELDSTATESQVEAWSSAKPTAVFGTNTMKALGDVPTVDIPVIVKKVMK